LEFYENLQSLFKHEDCLQVGCKLLHLGKFAFLYGDQNLASRLGNASLNYKRIIGPCFKHLCTVHCKLLCQMLSHRRYSRRLL